MQPCMNQLLKGSAITKMECLGLGSQQVCGGLMSPGCHISARRFARFPNPPSFDTKESRESYYYYSMSCSFSNECWWGILENEESQLQNGAKGRIRGDYHTYGRQPRNNPCKTKTDLSLSLPFGPCILVIKCRHRELCLTNSSGMNALALQMPSRRDRTPSLKI